MLVLITKTLQSLANGIKLGGKEPYMSKLNDFIDENQDEINEFFDELAVSTHHCINFCVLSNSYLDNPFWAH